MAYQLLESTSYGYRVSMLIRGNEYGSYRLQGDLNCEGMGYGKRESNVAVCHLRLDNS